MVSSTDSISASGTTSAFAVQIGSYIMNKIAGPIDSEGHVPYGRPNPTRIIWSKDNSIKTHEIPWPKHKTCKTSKETLWKLDLDFVVLTKADIDDLQILVDQAGPYMVRTAFKSIEMYIMSFTANAEEGKDDYRHTCTMKLIECND
jgi:hypothetical protein